MPLVTSNTDKNPQHDLQQLTNSMWAFGVNGNPYSGELLGSNGEAYFIYELTENKSATSNPTRDELGLDDYTVDGLTYDDSKIFAKVKVTDNWDGTLSFDVRYYTDASCKDGTDGTEITNHKAWIVDKLLINHYVSKADSAVTKTVGEYNALSDAEKAKYEAVYDYVIQTDPFADVISAAEYKALTAEEKAKYTNRLKRLLTSDEREQAEAMKAAGNTDELAAAGYREINIAHFDNYETVDIPVKKQWIDGPAIEDVTLHLERHLVPLSYETQLDGTGGLNLIDELMESWKPERYTKKTDPRVVITPEDYAKLTEDEQEEYELNGDFWKKLGYLHDVERGLFLKDGKPNYDDSTNKISSVSFDGTTPEGEHKKDFVEGFNKDLPKYVVKDGVTYRAIYRLTEDDTSDAYTREIDPQYYINDSRIASGHTIHSII